MNTTTQRLFRGRFRLRSEPGTLIVAAIVAALLFLFILLPVFVVFLRSFGIGAGQITLQYYVKFFQNANYFKALTNSVLVAIVSTVIILFISIPYALYVTRTNSVISKWYRNISLLPLVAPPFIFSLALIILLGRRGIVTQLIDDWFGWNFSIYGFWGVVTAQVLGFFPIAYMMIESSLRSMNPNLEHASRDLGANQTRTLFKVTLPLAETSILKAGLLVFVMALADFSNPIIIGGGEPFLASDAYLLIIGRQDLEMAAVIGVFLIVPSFLVFLYQTYILKDHDVMSIDGSAGMGNAPLNHKWQAFVFTISTVMTLFIVIMFLMVVLGAFVQIIGVNHELTLKHFSHQSNWDFMYNSVFVSLSAAFLAAGLGIVQGYLTVRKTFPGRRMMEFVSLFGLAVPGTVIGIGYILVFNGPPFFLTGTMWLITLNMAFRKIGVGLEAGISKLHQLDRAIEEASFDLGAGTFRTFRKIVFPLLSPAFMAGFVYTFMTSMVSVSSVIFLISPGTNLAAVYILNLANHAEIGRASAMSFVLIMIVLGCVVVLQWFERRSHIKL